MIYSVQDCQGQLPILHCVIKGTCTRRNIWSQSLWTLRATIIPPTCSWVRLAPRAHIQPHQWNLCARDSLKSGANDRNLFWSLNCLQSKLECHSVGLYFHHENSGVDGLLTSVIQALALDTFIHGMDRVGFQRTWQGLSLRFMSSQSGIVRPPAQQIQGNLNLQNPIHMALHLFCCHCCTWMCHV